MSENKHPIKQKRRTSWIWWVILLALLVWTAWTIWPKTDATVVISYSAFINQVKAGNVSKVEIQGSEIIGAFNKPISDPKNSTTLSFLPSPTLNQYSTFQTIFPETIGDPALISLLTNHNVEVNVTSPPSIGFTILFTSGLPALLLVLVIALIGRDVWLNQARAFNLWQNGSRPQALERRPRLTFADVADSNEAKEQLKDVVEFLRHPDKYHRLEMHIPAGIILTGSPGTGKTLLARAVAGEAGVPFYSMRASEYSERSAKDGANRLHSLFEQARINGPSVVFIDELDAIGHLRGTGLNEDTDGREQILDQLLVEMDGLDEHHTTIVLSAATHLDVIEPALLQRGRFDHQITLSLPDRMGREKALIIHTRNLHLAQDVDLHLLARTTTGFSGADLANLCSQAAIKAARQEHSLVSMEDFEDALDRLLLGTRRNLLLNDHSRKVIAYHEAGHALVAWLTPAGDSLQKVTIIEHEVVSDFIEYISAEEGYNISQELLLAHLSVILGGRAAEEIALGDVTTASEKDLVKATRLARRMVARWGMGSLGPMALSRSDESDRPDAEIVHGRGYSEEIAARIDEDILQLLRERYQAVHRLLEGSREKLERLVEALLKDETVERDELIRILGPRTTSSENDQNGQSGKTGSINNP